MSGALVLKSKAEVPKRARGSCKRCRRRRKVEKSTGLCQECTAYQAGANTTTPVVKKQDPILSIEERMGELCLSNLDHRAVEQMQMLSNWVETHYGAPRSPEMAIARKSSYILELPGMNTSSPLLRSAINSLCLAYFGSQSGNEHLLPASRSAYQNLLASITDTLRRAATSPSKDHRELITSIMLLSLYDGNRASPSTGPKAPWVNHFWGGLQYLESFGPSCMDLERIVDTKLFANLRLSALILSWIRKQALVFDRPEWRISAKTSVFTSDFDEWYLLLAGLGGLLEKAERLRNGTSPADTHKLASLCAQFADRRCSLTSWLEREAQPSDAGIPGIGSASITDVDAFDVEIEEHCFMTTSHCFVTFFRFSKGPRQALRCLSMWLACLIIDCTLLRILIHHPAASSSSPSLSLPTLEHRAYTSATNICRSVYGFAKLSSITYAHFLAMSLHLARTFFEEHASLKEMGWSQACLIATNMRIDRLKTSQRPTLCRVQHLSHADLEDYGRYRSPLTTTASSSTAGVVLPSFSGVASAQDWASGAGPARSQQQQPLRLERIRALDLPRCPIRAS